MKNFILKDMHNGVCTITLNNHKKKNALSLSLLKELEQNLEHIQKDGAIQSLILQGTGDAFSVGADLSDVTGTVVDQEIDDHLFRVCCLLQELPFPCIAAIEGPCIGGAVSVSLGCDVLVASEKAYFEIPAIRLELLYNPDSVSLLWARLGYTALSRLLLLGERWNAETALQAGLVGFIVPEGCAYEKALEIIKKTPKSPKVLSATKSMLLAIENGEKNLSKWKEIRQEILCSQEREYAVIKAKKRLKMSSDKTIKK
jgi:enoyl-CoA hydratase/carnithine racemase